MVPYIERRLLHQYKFTKRRVDKIITVTELVYKLGSMTEVVELSYCWSPDDDSYSSISQVSRSMANFERKEYLSNRFATLKHDDYVLIKDTTEVDHKELIRNIEI